MCYTLTKRPRESLTTPPSVRNTSPGEEANEKLRETEVQEKEQKVQEEAKVIE